MKKLLVLGATLLPACAFAQRNAEPARPPSAAPKPILLDIDARSPHRFATVCLAASKGKHIGQGKSSKSPFWPRPVGQMEVKSSELYLQAIPDQPTVLVGADKRFAYNGMMLLLVNTTGSAQHFGTFVGDLGIFQEALDEKGQWQPIEFRLRQGCGNALGIASLGSNEYWSFDVPRYKGTFKTKLRFRFPAGFGNTDLFSNEFEGSVNPEQFLLTSR